MRISGINAVYTMFRGSVKGTDYRLNSPVSASLPLPCDTACHHISTGVYHTGNLRLRPYSMNTSICAHYYNQYIYRQIHFITSLKSQMFRHQGGGGGFHRQGVIEQKNSNMMSWRALGTGHLSSRAFHEGVLERGFLYSGPRKIC